MQSCLSCLQAYAKVGTFFFFNLPDYSPRFKMQLEHSKLFYYMGCVLHITTNLRFVFPWDLLKSLLKTQKSSDAYI